MPLGVGKRSNRWSAITIRLALAVYCRSPAAYGALKSFGLLQLPSRSTLQAFTGAFLEDCGKLFYPCTYIRVEQQSKKVKAPLFTLGVSKCVL